MADLQSNLLDPSTPESLALDAINEARLSTAKAMFVCIVHEMEDGSKDVWFDECGTDKTYLLWGLMQSQKRIIDGSK